MFDIEDLFASELVRIYQNNFYAFLFTNDKYNYYIPFTYKNKRVNIVK